MGPCSLLSPDQVEQVYGEDPGEPESIEHEYVALGNSPACFWNEVGARITRPAPPGSAPQAFYSETIRRMDPTETLPCLGDEARTEASELTRGLAEPILQNLP